MNTTERELTVAVRTWLSDGPTDLPERVLDDVLVQLPLTAQRRQRPSLAWLVDMVTPLRLATAAIVIAAVTVFGIGLLSPAPDIVRPAASSSSMLSPVPSTTLDLEPPTDVDAYVRSAYDALVDLPALSVTVVEQEGTKARYAYDGTETVRMDHFDNATNDTPSLYLLFTHDTRGELTELDGRPVWLEISGQGHPLAELSGTLGLQRACDTGWRYVGLEDRLDRPVHHVACGGSEMWLDVETRLPLRSVRVQGEDQPTTVRDVTELRVGPQDPELFQPPPDAVRMSDAGYQCASDPACTSPAPVRTPRPLVTPAPAPSALAVPGDLDGFVVGVIATLDAPPAVEIETIERGDQRTWYLSDGTGRSRIDHDDPPSATDPAEVIHANGHRYERGRGDRYLDVGPTTRSALPDWGLHGGCPTGWSYRGTDLVMGRPAHHLACDLDHYWIDAQWSLVTRHQRDPDVLGYDADLNEVLDVRFRQPDPDLFELPSTDEDGRTGTGSPLTWRRISLDEAAPLTAWLGDRFVALDPDRGDVRVSRDGSTWTPVAQGDPDRRYLEVISDRGTMATWEDTVTDWDAGSVRSLVPPEGPSTTSDFAGDIGAVGLGPAGIVARVHSGIDFDAFVTGFIGPDWVGHMTRFEFVDGVLHIATDDGRSVDIDMAAEGLGPGDVADRGYGWFSEDGSDWSLIPDFPSNVMGIVGVADGFIAVSDVLWHSPDGTTWRTIDGPSMGDGELVPWQDGAVGIGQSGELVLWTASGARTLAPSTLLPFGGRGAPAMDAGPLGLVAVGESDVSVVFPDGEWVRAPMPDAMYASSGSGRRQPRVVVGDEAVLVTLWSRGQVPSVWLGTRDRLASSG